MGDWAYGFDADKHPCFCENCQYSCTSLFTFRRDHSFIMYDSPMLPRINYVSQVFDSDSNNSTYIDGLAMKYLKDDELTEVAQARTPGSGHRGAQAKRSAATDVTMYGISANNMTIHTREYLEKYCLAGEAQPHNAEEVWNQHSTASDTILYKTPEHRFVERRFPEDSASVRASSDHMDVLYGEDVFRRGGDQLRREAQHQPSPGQTRHRRPGRQLLNKERLRELPKLK